MNITQSLAQDFLSVLRRLLPRRVHNQHVVELRRSADGLGLRFTMDGYALAWGSIAAEPTDCLRMPVQLLKDCAAATQHPITVNVSGDLSIQSQWTDHGIPQTRRYARVAADEPVAFPRLPPTFAEQSSDLLAALAEAALTCDSFSTRYAVRCIRIRGSRGDLAATDGRQILLQGGFELGFDDEILVPGSKVFTSPVWKTQPVAVGLTDDHFVLRLGAWSLWLPIQKEGRFPRVDDIIPDRSCALSAVEWDDGDRNYLAQHLDRLPGNDDPHSPVTVELNGSTVVRARDSDSSHSTELVLCHARRQGGDCRFQTNRQYLQRAARLGLSSMYVFGDRQPVLCADARRSYVWALLDPSDCWGPTAEDVRIFTSPEITTAVTC